jgi:hypothetical protein
MLVTAPGPGVTVAGLRVQVTPVGAAHDKVTVLANPFAGVMVSVKLADPPAATVAFCGVAVSE